MPISDNPEYTNFYQTTRTIRFNLLPMNHTVKIKEKIKEEWFEKELDKFLQNYKTVVTNLEYIMFNQDKHSSGRSLDIKIVIKLAWLKIYCKQEFFENEGFVKQTKTNSISLQETNFLKNILGDWIDKNYKKVIGTDKEQDFKQGNIIELEKLKNLPKK